MPETTKKPILVGIAGAPGVGKSTLAKNLKRFYPELVESVHLDDYCYPKELIRSWGLSYSHPKTVDYLQVLSHLRFLAASERAQHNREYSFAVGDVVETLKEYQERPIIVCEGWTLFHYWPLRKFFDLRIYIKLPREDRVQRIVRREKRAKHKNRLSSERLHYLLQVSPPEQEYYAALQRRYADVILDSNQSQEQLVAAFFDFLGEISFAPQHSSRSSADRVQASGA